MRTHPATTSLVEADLACVACNYNLRMQPVAGRCPECGAAIRHTLEFPHLARSAPRWLVSLLDSVTVLLAALVLAAVALVVRGGRDDVLSLSVATAPWGTAWFAMWLLTRPEPGVRDSGTRAWAWLLRALTTLGYAGVFAARPVYELFDPYGVPAVLLLTACLAPATGLYYNHLRRAANRLPNGRLAYQALALQVLMPLAALLAAARLLSGVGPRSGVEFLLRAPMVGLGSVGDALAFFEVLRGGYGLLDWLPVSTAPSAVLLLAAVAVLAQFRIAFAAAVRQAGGR